MAPPASTSGSVVVMSSETATTHSSSPARDAGWAATRVAVRTGATPPASNVPRRKVRRVSRSRSSVLAMISPPAGTLLEPHREAPVPVDVGGPVHVPHRHRDLPARIHVRTDEAAAPDDGGHRRKRHALGQASRADDRIGL